MATYAFSDLHGQRALWEQIKDFIKPEDTVYCLGDSADRGPDGWEILKEILDTPNIYYIRGNHDQFIIDDDDRHLWYYNGGLPTMEYMDADLHGTVKWYQQELKAAPLYRRYISESGLELILCHAGFDPQYWQDQDDEDFLWDRHHMRRPWRKTDPDFIIIHGHTPIQYIEDYLYEGVEIVDEGAQWYCDGHKCCIDQGSFLSGRALLLDLDTFEEHMFYAEVEQMYMED